MKLLVFLMAVSISCSCAAGDGAASNAQQVQPEAPGKSLLGHALPQLSADYERHLLSGGKPHEFTASNPKYRIVEGRVLIDAVASDTLAALEADLLALGATGVSSRGRIASCFFPIGKIDELATLSSLHSAKPAIMQTR